jgi:hypothetical protein
MSRVALLMVLQLMGHTGNDSLILHQNTAKSLSGCITIDHEVLWMSDKERTGVVVSFYFRVWKLSSHSGVHSNSLVFFRRLVMGLAILEKFSMNL